MPIRTRGNGLHHGPSGDCSSSLDMVSWTVIYMAGIIKQSFSLTSFLSRSVYVSCFGELTTRNLFKRVFHCQWAVFINTLFITSNKQNKEKWTYLKVMAIFHRNNHGEPCLSKKEKPSVPSAMKRLLPPPLNRQPLASSWFLSGREAPCTKLRQSASPDFLNNVRISKFQISSNIILLAKRRTRGMDGRLEIVAQWYQQRLSIHAFVACNLMPNFPVFPVLETTSSFYLMIPLTNYTWISCHDAHGKNLVRASVFIHLYLDLVLSSGTVITEIYAF
ncbi:hypothetical protein T11_5254 [Trichinella zimbabwensis]|uniref:Uncharacterized protein n=1 Tax=Trichinella zimbabwensis TaxID=268475 RepID=A0A0V1H2L1_9BILA|nr:hypothetical protein T11_5254 [Trichinella zimbabwensis]